MLSLLRMMLWEDSIVDWGRSRWCGMPDMLETRVLELRRHHLWFDGAVVGWPRSIILIVIVVHLPLPAEVCWTFVFVGSSILRILAQPI